MENNKIIVDLARVKNILIADIKNMPSSLKGVGVIIANEGYKIGSAQYAMITDKALYLTGLFNDSTRLMSHDYPTDEEAQKALEHFKLLIHEYNTHCKKVETTIKWERAE